MASVMVQARNGMVAQSMSVMQRLGRGIPGKPFYIVDESNLRTWKADVNADGSLTNFQLFAENGGESVTSDSEGNVFLAAGEIYVYDPDGKLMDTIETPQRPIQIIFGGRAVAVSERGGCHEFVAGL